MKRQKIQKYQMLARVADFLAKHVGLFPKHTAAVGLLAALQSIVARLSGLAASQVTNNAAIRTGSNARAAARKALRTLLELFNQTAQTLRLDGFLMPVHKNDQELIDAGHHFALLAEPFKDEFILQGLLIENLNGAVQALEAAALSQAAGREGRSAAIRDFDNTLGEALNYLQRFQVIVSSTMPDNPAFLAGWNVARHLDRVGRSKPEPELEPDTEVQPPVPPDNPTSSTAAA